MGVTEFHIFFVFLYFFLLISQLFSVFYFPKLYLFIYFNRAFIVQSFSRLRHVCLYSVHWRHLIDTYFLYIQIVYTQLSTQNYQHSVHTFI